MKNSRLFSKIIYQSLDTWLIVSFAAKCISRGEITNKCYVLVYIVPLKAFLHLPLDIPCEILLAYKKGLCIIVV